MAPRTRFLVALVLVASILTAGVAGLAARLLAWPSEPALPAADPVAGRRVQSVIAQLLLRESGLSSREEPLALTASELNAFLHHQVEVRDSPVWPVRVRLDATEVDLGGPTTLGRLAAAGLGAGVARALPVALGSYPIWVGVTGQVTVDRGRAQLLVRRGVIGRQRVPLGLLWRLLGGRPPALTWRMPRIVTRVDVEAGRLLIHTGRGRPGAAAG